MLKTMTLLALVMLTSAAPTEPAGRELWWWHDDDDVGPAPQKRCKGRKLDAKVVGNALPGNQHFVAEVEGCSVRDTEDGWLPDQLQWTVDIKTDATIFLDSIMLEPSAGGEKELVHLTEANKKCKAYNWHIHKKPVGEHGQCGPRWTGGHTDPGLACGSASEYAGAVCQRIGDTPSYKDRCISSPTGDVITGAPTATKQNGKQAGCEEGDLSGKMGPIAVAKGKTNYIDNFIAQPKNYDGMSIVFHCCIEVDGYKKNCGSRVACGDLDY
jgi:hypothetical protein